MGRDKEIRNKIHHNKKMKNAHNFEPMYEDLGIDLDDLGCVMLDLRTTPEFMALKEGFEADLYKSDNPKRHWINGFVADKMAHVTLFYGLLEEARKWRDHIETVLEGIEIPAVTIQKVTSFDSPYEDEKYFCIVAELVPTAELLAAHRRLQFLPHINTFEEYRPHMTICYISAEKGKEYRNFVVQQMNDMIAGRELPTRGLNFGDKKQKDG